MAHLDRPYGDWSRSVTATPANAMHLPTHGRLAPGLGADFIVFRARRYSELLSRPQGDRVVVRNGTAIDAILPDYSELDYVPMAIRSGEVPVAEVDFVKQEGTPVVTTNLGGVMVVNGSGSGTRRQLRGQTGAQTAAKGMVGLVEAQGKGVFLPLERKGWVAAALLTCLVALVAGSFSIVAL